MNTALWFAQGPTTAEGQTPDQPAKPTGEFTPAQIRDFQGDFSLYCPQIKLNFVNGVDAETGIREVADNGSVPHGIHNGWIWTPWLPFYPPEKREIIYAEMKKQGWTHCNIHMAQEEPSGGYHGLRPITQDDCDHLGEWNMQIHRELMAHGIIPICRGVAPAWTHPDGRVFPAYPVAKGFNEKEAICVTADWDNTNRAAERILYLNEQFTNPKAMIFFEHSGPAPIPDESPGDPVPPTIDNGGHWLAGMQDKVPRFIGVQYEVDGSASIDDVLKDLSERNKFWRDVQQIHDEDGAYETFWQNRTVQERQQRMDEILRRAPQLQGCQSGATTHPPPVTVEEEGGTLPSGDAIPVTDIVWEAGTDFTGFAVTTILDSLRIGYDDIYTVFDKQAKPPAGWSEAIPPGWEGGIQYSMGLVIKCSDGRWHGAAPIELWTGKPGGGGPIADQTVVDDKGHQGQIQCNWFYNRQWFGLLEEQRPQAGTQMGFFVCQGSARNHVHVVRERSNIVLFTLPVQGVEVTYER